MSKPEEAEGATPDNEPEVDAEIVEDLDVEDGDEDVLRGGACPKSRPV